MEPGGLLSCSQKPATGPYREPFETFRNMLDFYSEGLLDPRPTPGGPPFVGCPRLLIQYILSYRPYVEAVSSIRSTRTLHAD